jgi:very-long-chain (3R)-3-hydroxyacyl-CoA dehydratase
MLLAWSVTEVIRYGYFTFTLSGYSPGVMTWLRYNTFYILYPLGISSECWLIYSAIEPAKQIRQEFAWALQLILFVYIPGISADSARVAKANYCRLICPLYTYDVSKEEDYEREATTEG